MLSDFAFYLDWNELPLEWREEKIEEVREKLVEQETDNYQGDWEESGYEKGYDSPEEYTREEIWTYDDVVEHIKHHFPIYF